MLDNYECYGLMWDNYDKVRCGIIMVVTVRCGIIVDVKTRCGIIIVVEVRCETIIVANVRCEVILVFFYRPIRRRRRIYNST